MTDAFCEADATTGSMDTTLPRRERPQSSASGRRRKPKRAQPDGLPRAALLQTLASLLWIPQAALLAWSVGLIAQGGGPFDVAIPAAGVLGLGALRAGLDAAGGRLAFCAARAELTRRRDIAATTLARRSPLDIDKVSSGFAASLLAEQAETIVPYIARFLPARSKASIVPPVILVCVLPVSWVAAIILIITAPLIPVFMALIGWRAKAASEKQLAQTGGLNAFLLDRLRGLATIRTLDGIDATARRLRDDAEDLRLRTMAVLKIAFLSSAVLELFAALGVAAMAVYVGFSLLGSIDAGTWHGKLTLTQGLFILLLSPAFFEPLRELSAVWHDRAAGEAAIEALDRVSTEGRTLPTETTNDAEHRDAEPGTPAIHIEKLDFRHGAASAPVFETFDLAIRPGEHVALLGASGSGKTTLLSLIAGLVPADGGAIRIGNRVLADATAEALRRRMVWIGQRPHIFAGSMIANIALGRPDITRSAILQAIDRSHLRHVAQTHGAAVIGEGGAGLSGGEALRLAIARAAVDGEADIILADEPTAHLDAETALDITDELLTLARGRTLIVATHDPVLSARMGRIVRLDALDREAAA